MGSQDGHRGGGGRKQPHDHRAVGGGDIGKGKRGAQREADHDAEGHNRQARQVPRRWGSLVAPKEHRGGQHRGDHGPSETNHGLIEVTDGQPRCRQREREGQHAESAARNRTAEPPTASRRPPSCYLMLGSSATLYSHARW